MNFGKIYVSCAFVLMLSLFWFLDDSGVFAAVIIGAALHEFGHIFALKALGGRLERVKLELGGAAIYFDDGNISYQREALIALAGPASGLVFALLLGGLSHIWPGLLLYAGVSASLSVLNLLPCFGLDGGVILTSLVSRCASRETAEKVLYISGSICIFALLIAGVFVLRTTGSNFSYLLAGLWLLANISKSRCCIIPRRSIK